MGHAEADSATTHADCPNGCGWDWDRYMALVQNAMPQQPPPPTNTDPTQTPAP
jgi:hypothetical protein